MLSTKKLLYKLLSLVSYESGNLTKSSSSISAVEFANYQKWGRVCIVRVNFTVSATITNSTETLFTGLPTHVGATRTTLQKVNTANPSVPARVSVTGNTLQNAYTSNGIQTGQYEGEIVYITA